MPMVDTAVVRNFSREETLSKSNAPHQTTTTGVFDAEIWPVFVLLYLGSNACKAGRTLASESKGGQLQKNKRIDNPKRVIWHYTTGENLPKIIASGVIRRASKGVELPEIPVTWFSLNEIWEVTASKIPLTVPFTPECRMALSHLTIGGLVRIGVELKHAPYKIYHMHPVANCDPSFVEALKLAGIQCGANPCDWRFTPNEVPSKLWKSIQVWDGKGRWVPYDGNLTMPVLYPVGSDKMLRAYRYPYGLSS